MRTLAVVIAIALTTVFAVAQDRSSIPTDASPRLMAARALIRDEPEKAADAYLVLWAVVRDYDRGGEGIRFFSIVNDMSILARSNASAKQKFTKLRDDLELKLKEGRSTWETLMDWVALNRVLGEESRTLAWFDRVKDDPTAAPDLERNAYRLKELLSSDHRWADVGRLYENPVREAIKHLHQGFVLGHSDDPRARRFTEDFGKTYARRACAELHVALLAAGRDGEAEKVATLLLTSLDDADTRRVMVRAAITAGQPRESHLKLLSEAGALKASRDDADIRELLTESLKTAPLHGAIRRTIAAFEASGATLLSGGKELSAKEAAEKFRAELFVGEDSIKSLDDFLELAVRTAPDGSPNRVRTKAGDTIPAEQWFREHFTQSERTLK